MNVYRRYFRITTGPLLDRIVDIESVNTAAHEEYMKIIGEIEGASGTYYQQDHRLVAIAFFDDVPDQKIFRSVNKHGWYPKKNNKIGRDLHKRLSTVKTLADRSALSTVGLGSPTIFANSCIYIPQLVCIPSDPKVCFVTVPWYDEDPKVLAEYVKDRDAGTRGDSNKDAILWNPSSDMVEVKEWQFRKEIDEWNEAVAVATTENQEEEK